LLHTPRSPECWDWNAHAATIRAAAVTRVPRYEANHRAPTKSKGLPFLLASVAPHAAITRVLGWNPHAATT